MFFSVKSTLFARAPRHHIWDTIREIASENERRPGEWTTEQWRRFCAALEKAVGEPDQIAANPLWRTYRVVKDMLGDNLDGPAINTSLRMIAENNDAEWRRKHMPRLAGPKLAPGPRRRPVTE